MKKARIKILNRTYGLTLLALTGLIAVGCGGSGGNTTTVQPQTQSFQITWPARSAPTALGAPGSALSAQVAFTNGSGPSISVKADRDSTKPSGYTGTYNLPSAITATSTTVTATFYAGTGETGSVVATAMGTAPVGSSTISLPGIALTNNITQVVVTPAATKVGASPIQLTFTDYDSKKDIVAVSAGSAKWAVASGSADLSLTNAGVATAIKAGSPTVTATVDGITSPAATVTISSATTGNFTYVDLLPAGDSYAYISCMSPSGRWPVGSSTQWGRKMRKEHAFGLVTVQRSPSWIHSPLPCRPTPVACRQVSVLPPEPSLGRAPLVAKKCSHKLGQRQTRSMERQWGARSLSRISIRMPASGSAVSRVASSI